MTRAQALRGHLTVLLLNLTALAATVWWLRTPAPGAVELQPPAMSPPDATATAPSAWVYVTGAVARPGVVRLRAGDRADAAVAAAGGLDPGADPAAINLAALVVDGQHLHVPAQGEAAPARAEIAGRGPDSDPAGDRAATGAGARGAASPEPMSLNAATAADLEALPGIGPALAARIVDYRAGHGPFETVRDLLNVSGIGEKTLARFADRLRVP